MEENLNLFDEETGKIKECEQGFVGLWLPAEVVLDKRLNAADKILYGEIASFPKGCWKKSSELMEMVGLTKNAFGAAIKRLIDAGYITQRRLAGGHILRKSTFGFYGGRGSKPKTPLVHETGQPRPQNEDVPHPQNADVHIEYTKEYTKNTQHICSAVAEHGVRVLKKPNNVVGEMIDFWNETMGGKLRSSDLNAYAIKRLLKLCGGDAEQLKRVVSALPLMVKEEGRYAPRVCDYVELEQKWNKVMAWGRAKAIAKKAEDDYELPI